MKQAYESNIDTSLLESAAPIRVLAVEDDPLSMAFLEAQVTTLNHSITKAENGQRALEILEANAQFIDVVLMDRYMPVMDGLDAVRRMQDHPKLRNIPVIMVTGADSADDMREGLDAGVFYYLTKPVNETMLRSVMSAAVREAKQTRTLALELDKHRTSFHLIETCKFKFQTLREAENLAAFIANCFPDPERTLSGLGELMINAVEHGNLGVGYDKKTQLLESDIWRSEIDRLQAAPEHRDKFARATIVHKDEGIFAIIEDMGEGFQWEKYLRIDPERAGDNHGRGIAQARVLSFDKLTYNDVGNQAVAFVGLSKPLQW